MRVLNYIIVVTLANAVRVQYSSLMASTGITHTAIYITFSGISLLQIANATGKWCQQLLEYKIILLDVHLLIFALNKWWKSSCEAIIIIKSI